MCGSVSGQAAPPPPGFVVSHLSLPALSLRGQGGVIDQSHQGDGGLDSSACTAGGNTGSFLNLSCYSEALHLLEQSRESSLSSMSLLFSQKPKSSPGLCHRNILFLCPDPCAL